MIIEIDVNKLSKLGLSPTDYCVLICIQDGIFPPWLNPDVIAHNKVYKMITDKLEHNMWIANSVDGLMLRKKGLDLLTDNVNVKFDVFYDKYRKVTGLLKTERTATEKYWNKLKVKDKQLALDTIELYYSNNKEYPHKARTYLSERHFEDEFNETKNNVSYGGAFGLRED